MKPITIERTATNEELRAAVLHEVEWRSEIHSQDINVKTSKAEVTLTGFVHTFAEKDIAEKAATPVHGVTCLANDIEVRPSMRTDPEIARDVQHVLTSNSMLVEKVIAMVDQGFVTLEGTVGWHFQEQAAARSVGGVRGINNSITVKPQVSPTSVKLDIETALRRSAMLDAPNIQVTSHDSTVKLSGKVKSFAEREEAELVAWPAPGVEDVQYRIQVRY